MSKRLQLPRVKLNFKPSFKQGFKSGLKPGLKRGMKLDKKQRRVVMIVGVLAWAVVLVSAAIPAWQKTRHNEDQLSVTMERHETLNQWAVAGIWLAEEVKLWQPTQQKIYDTLFPTSKQREELFLSLVKVANESGIDPIRILEAEGNYRPGASGENNDYDDYEDGDYDDGNDEAGNEDEVLKLVDEFAPDLMDLPDDALIAHRVRVSCETGYAELARFLAGLKTIPRAVNVHRLTATNGAKGIDVSMELEFYVQKRD
jgi:hypothetical protein